MIFTSSYESASPTRDASAKQWNNEGLHQVMSMGSTLELDIEDLPTVVRWGVKYHQKVQLARSKGRKRYAPLPTRIKWWFLGSREEGARQ